MRSNATSAGICGDVPRGVRRLDWPARTYLVSGQPAVDGQHPPLRWCVQGCRRRHGTGARRPLRGRWRDDEAAWQAAWPAAEKLTAGYRRGGEQVKRRISTEEELETERWLREVAIVGSPDAVAERITALHQELGFGNFMLVTGFLGNLPQEEVIRTLALFAKEVRPRLQRTLELAGDQPVGDPRHLPRINPETWAIHDRGH
jgi:hypothetical protein